MHKGDSAASALAFQCGSHSTNLVWELGLVLWVLKSGWQYHPWPRYNRGIVMIGPMAGGAALFVSRSGVEAGKGAPREAEPTQHAPRAGA